MLESVVDLIFPKSCCICNLAGWHVCPSCERLFKRQLPECYTCRRISNCFKTHPNCEGVFDSVFVAWEYNGLSSDILKVFKYKSVSDIAKGLAFFFCDALKNSCFGENLDNTLLVSVPVSTNRLNDRGFNQTELIVEELGNLLKIEFNSNLLRNISKVKNHALMDKDERLEKSKERFVINTKDKLDISMYSSITIFDDVITTGSTLEEIGLLLKETYGKDIKLQALCLFRGKPYYSDSELVSDSTVV